jgi:hypothetical protein
LESDVAKLWSTLACQPASSCSVKCARAIAKASRARGRLAAGPGEPKKTAVLWKKRARSSSEGKVRVGARDRSRGEGAGELASPCGREALPESGTVSIGGGRFSAKALKWRGLLVDSLRS